MVVNATNVFKRTIENRDKRIITHQGGARSSKTYSICQYLILTALEQKVSTTIARGKLTWLTGSAMVDFFEVLDSLGLYNPSNHNKSKLIYTLPNGSNFQFIGLDDAQKLRGRKQHRFWINEANEVSYEDFRQANMRTTQQLILDFNPSDEFHWIYDNILVREDCALIQSTYKDNRFLDKMIINEIEALKDVDPDYYSVFGLGNRGQSRELIYGNHSIFHNLPEGCNRAYGLDFGFNHPTALIDCAYIDGNVYWTEVIYQSALSSGELVKLMNDLKIDKRRDMYCDPARPEIIKEIRQAGYNAKPATKHVYEDISAIKGNKIHIHGDSSNLLKEARNYKWKRHAATNNIMDEPVKFMDDAMDAARYGTVPILGRNVKKSPRSMVVSVR